jgi:hypothetical protein
MFIAHRAAVPASNLRVALNLQAHQKAADYTVEANPLWPDRRWPSKSVAPACPSRFAGGLQALHDFWSVTARPGLAYGVVIIFSVLFDLGFH